MPLVADVYYRARLQQIALTESGKGTVGFACVHKTEAGTIEGTIWITPGTRDRTIESLEAMGASESDWRDPKFFSDPSRLVGRQDYKIVCEEEEYKGEKRLKVKWINSLSKRPAVDAAAKAAALLSGDVVVQAETIDEKLPF